MRTYFDLHGSYAIKKLIQMKCHVNSPAIIKSVLKFDQNM